MSRKYELIKEDFIERESKKLYRIRALMDFGDVKAGEIGGYIKKEENLSHAGDAWVADDAQVFQDAWVSDDAMVYGNAMVFGDAWVFGKAEVFGDAQVYGKARVFDDAQICSDVCVCGNASIGGKSKVFSSPKSA